MTKYFTHYWKNSTWEDNRNSQFADYAVKHISGNDLSKRGIEIGDVVFIITVKEGKLFLSGKLTVGKFCTRKEAAKEMNCEPTDLWDAKEHIIASNFTPTTKKYWDLQVPTDVTEQLEFISGNEIKTLKFKSKNYLDQQTLRSVRRLTPESAQKLDEVLSIYVANQAAVENVKSNWQIESVNNEQNFESALEGNKSKRFVTKYERDPKLRKQAIQIHGYTCKVCEFNFEKHYGKHGKDFIHVHHLKPLFQFEEARKVNPQTDMTVLCPNCHSMIHRNKNKTLSIEELKDIYKK